MKTYYVYILASKPMGTLYVGVTSDLVRRVYLHRTGVVPGFTSRYHVKDLVYFEHTTDVRTAIEREKQIRAWRRSKKIALIESTNPYWADLSRVIGAR